jgi:DNA-binding response OmpR family regulator
MLTARNDEPSIVAALDAGADDYIAKPFSPRQLLARIRAAMRHAGR